MSKLEAGPDALCPQCGERHVICCEDLQKIKERILSQVREGHAKGGRNRCASWTYEERRLAAQKGAETRKRNALKKKREMTKGKK